MILFQDNENDGNGKSIVESSLLLSSLYLWIVLQRALPVVFHQESVQCEMQNRNSARKVAFLGNVAICVTIMVLLAEIRAVTSLLFPINHNYNDNKRSLMISSQMMIALLVSACMCLYCNVCLKLSCSDLEGVRPYRSEQM